MKPLLLSLLSILLITEVTAQSQQGPNNGSTSSTMTLTGSSQSWVTTNQAGASDNSYSSFGDIPNTAGAYTNYLVVTGFGFTVPFGASISGIMVEIERSDPNGLTSDYSIRLVKNAAVRATDRSTGTPYPTTDAYQTYGGFGDTWGDTWSYKDVSGGSFGVAIAAQRNATGGTTDGRIDHVRITLFFSVFVTLPVNLTSFTATKNNNAVHVKWNTTDESNIAQYEVERSSNGRDYHVVGMVFSRNSTNATDYDYTDRTPVKGTSWYRLKIVSQSGDVKYSPVAIIRIDETGKNNLYPSDISTGQPLSISNAGSEPLRIRFVNNSGQVAASVISNSGQVPANTLKTNGVYYYTIIDEKGIVTGNGKIIVR
jgi:hypothetical protein